jgi:hypothetical protein
MLHINPLLCNDRETNDETTVPVRQVYTNHNRGVMLTSLQTNGFVCDEAKQQGAAVITRVQLSC